MTVLFYVTLLVVTTLIWGYIFYKKDYHPQPFKVLGQTFLMGILAMIPVFMYKYAYQHFLPNLSEFSIFRPILDSAFLTGMSVFFLNLAMLSLILWFFSALLSAILYFFSPAVLVNCKEALQYEPLAFTMVSFLIGLIVYFQSFIQHAFHVPVIGTILGTVLFLAIIEEYIKHLIIRIVDDKKLRDIDDAITLSVVAGLAFAFIETIVYAMAVGSVDLIFYRMLVTIPIHLVSSGVFGYYYGLAHFAKPIVQLEEGKDSTYRSKWLPRILCLKRSTVYYEERLVEGIFFATLFHAAMNLMFEFNLGFLTIPFIIAGVLVIFRLYKLAWTQNQLLKRLHFLPR